MGRTGSFRAGSAFGRHHRLGGRRTAARIGACLAVGVGVLVGTVSGVPIGSPPAAAAGSPCNISVSSGSGTVVVTAGGDIITGATPGSTRVTADCNKSVNPADLAQASLLAGAATSSVSATNLADIGTLTSFTASPTDTGCPAATAGSCSLGTLTVPNPFTAPDANAVCPVSQANVNDGLFACAASVVDSSLAPIAGGEFLIMYTGQATPAAPTIASTMATGVAGNNIPVADAAGHAASWWADAIQTIQAGILGTGVTPPPSTCAGAGFGNVPTTPFLAVHWVPTLGGPSIVGSASGITLSNLCYDGTTVHAPALSGSIPVPATATPGATYNVYLCEVDGLPIPSNDPSVAAHCGTAPLSGATWIDASFPFTVEPSESATASPSSGGVGTPVTVNAVGLNSQSGTVFAGFSTGTQAPAALGGTGPVITGSTGSCAPVASDGTDTCTISVTAADTLGSNPIALYQSTAPTPTLYATFTVAAVATTCSVVSPATDCSIQQVVTLSVSKGSLGVGTTGGSGTVTMTPITLDGAEQNATGSLNQIVVADERGTLAGWTVVGQFESNFLNSSGSGVDNTIDVGGSRPYGFNWVPTVTPVTSNASEVSAGPSTTGGLSTSGPTTLCLAPPGGGGGSTDCDATFSLGVHSSNLIGSYSATLLLTVS